MPEAVLDRIRRGHAAGVLLFAPNLASQQQARANAESIQAAATASPGGAPAIIATDQEGGLVSRIPGPPTSSASELGSRPRAVIEAQGRATAENLLAWGVNVDLAPVADVVRPGSFLESQRRSFSTDPAAAAGAVAAFVRGLDSGGVAATLKHFPGLGAATMNTDEALSEVALSAEELIRIDLVPFSSGINAGAELVMVSSATYSALDDAPAVASPRVVDDLLRNQLGFEGVVVSDAMDTPALAPLGTTGEAAVAAAHAGVDLFIVGGTHGCVDIQRALAHAIGTGTLDIDAARDAALRVDALRRHLTSG